MCVPNGYPDVNSPACEDNHPFKPWPKIPRLSREIIITEKIDGTNASIDIGEDGTFLVGSRTRWITPEKDNFGFAAWARDNKEELLKLGPGHHFGEWWGKGIQRGYGLNERRFSLFNTKRWVDPRGIGLESWPDEEKETCPDCCRVVPVLYRGPFSESGILSCLNHLSDSGSDAAPGFMDPEGIIIYHVAGGHYYKKTVKDDEKPKLENTIHTQPLQIPDPFQVLEEPDFSIHGDKLADNPENQ